MQGQLAQLDSARKRFIATASHELRTPLFSLGGFLELLEDEELDDDTRRAFIRQVRQQTLRLQKLATDLLDLSRLEAGSLELRPEPTDVGSLTRTVVAEFAPAIAAHDSSLELRLARSPIEADCDPERVAQVLRILLNNALTHTPRGTGLVVSAARQNGTLRLAVRDDGPGIDRASLERVFEPFYTSDDAQGSGLGPDDRARARRAHDGPSRRPHDARGDDVRAEAAGLTRAPAAVGGARLVVAGAALGGLRARRGGDTRERTRTVAVTTRVEVFADEPTRTTFDPQRIYEREAPGVVTVFSVFGGGGLLDRDPQQEASGSGFVLDGDGGIVTNAHVVTEGEGGSLRRASDVYVQFADGNQVEAQIVGVDANSDVALLRIDPAGLTLRPLPLGSSRALEVGAPVAAIGSPYGEPQSLSVGVISGLDRSIDSLTGFSIDGAIQTDAAINRGNSGGPLVDAHGRVLGINSQIRSTGGGGEGVGFAVPVDTVRRVLGTLRRDGEIHYAFLGVQTTAIYPQLAERFDLPVDEGAWVQGLTKDGPADDAGIRAGDERRRFQARTYEVGGDVVTRVDGVAGARPEGPQRPAAGPPPGRRRHARGAARRQAALDPRAPRRAPAGRERVTALPELCVALARRLRERVLPELGSHAGRVARGRGRRRRRDVRDRRGRRGRARGVPGRARARRSRSTARTAAWSPPPGAEHVLVVDPIDGTRPAMAGLESACVSVAAAPLAHGEPTMGAVQVASIVEVKTGREFHARRGRGVRSTAPVAPSANTALDRMFWTYGFRGRPARMTVEVLGDLIDALLGRRRDVRARLRLLRLHVRPHRAARRLRGARRPPGRRDPVARDAFERVGNGHVLNNSPYDLAAAVLLLEEAGRRRHRRGRPERCATAPLLGSGADFQMSILACGNVELHRLVLAEMDRGIDRARERFG